MLESRYLFTAVFVCLILSFIHISAAVLLEERRFSIKKAAVIWITTALVFFLMVYLFYSFLPPTLRLSVTFSASFIYFWITFIYTSADGIWKKCYLWVTYGTLFAVLWPLSVMISNIFHLDSDIIPYFIRASVQFVLCVPVLLLYRKYIRPLVKEVSGFYSKNWLRLFLVSIIRFLIAVVLMVSVISSGFSRNILILYILYALSFTAENMNSVNIIRYMNETMRIEAVRENVTYMKSSVESAMEREAETKRMRHDLRHHYESIASMARDGDTEAILRYIGENEKNYEKSRVWCLNTTINGILASFDRKCEEKKILFSASADIPAISPVKDVDYVAVLANLIENALNETERIGSGGPVTADIKSTLGKIVIVVTNPSGDIKIENGIPLKRSIGIDSIITAVRKYNGEVNYTLSDGICSCCIVLSP